MPSNRRYHHLSNFAPTPKIKPEPHEVSRPDNLQKIEVQLAQSKPGNWRTHMKPFPQQINYKAKIKGVASASWRTYRLKNITIYGSHLGIK